MSAFLIQPVVVPARVDLPSDFEEQMAAALTAQYHRAVSGLAQVVFFGAMLMQAQEEVLSNIGQNSGATRGPSAKGKGFDSWLEAHCPQISRQKAYRFREVAAAVMAEFKIKTPSDVQRLLSTEAAAPKEAKLQQALFDFMEDRSVNGLLTEIKRKSAPITAGKYHARKPAAEDNRTPEEKRADDIKAAGEEAAALLVQNRAWLDNRAGEGVLTKAIRSQLHAGFLALAEAAR